MYKILSRERGSQHAMSVIEEVCNLIDSTLIGDMYSAILSEKTNITITEIPRECKVDVVKCIRKFDFRRLTLAEAVSLVNDLIGNNVSIELELHPDHIEEVRIILNHLRCSGPGIY
jgi:hypothetical protein